MASLRTGGGITRTGGPAGGATGPTTAPANPSAGGFGSFGRTTTTPTTGGFGAKPAGTTGGFGSTGAAATATGGFGAKPAGTGGFGATGAAATTTGGFGAKPAGTTGGFGSTGAAATTTGGFGAKPAGTAGGFGATGAAATTTGGFGAKPGGITTGVGAASTTTTGGYTKTAGGFGQMATGGFGAAGAGQQQQQQQQQGALQALVARIQQIGNRLHPDSPYCALRHVFYNRVDPAQVKYYKRPEKFDVDLWVQAMEVNPDASHLVPTQARGFADLKARLDAQDHETGVQATCLAEAETFLASMQEQHALQTAVKLEQLKRDSLLLGHRVLKVAALIEILRARGLSIQPDEDSWRQLLHNQHVELSKPNEYRGRLNELASRVRMQQQIQQQHLQIQQGGGGGSFSSSNDLLPSSSSSSASSSSFLPESFSPSEMEQISAFLSQQQTGLEHLIEILQADMKNLTTLTDHAHLLKRD